MWMRLTNLRRPVEADEQELLSVIASELKLNSTEIASWKILRKSLDARARHDLEYVYSLALEIPDAARSNRLFKQVRDLDLFEPKPFQDPPAGENALEHRPVVVGSGPAGLLAAYYLATRGYQPLLLERGYPVKQRVPAIRDFDRGGEFLAQNNYLFGEGGAGCFSDGKLTCRMSGPDVDWVLQSFIDCGGNASILYEHRPHLGSNKLPMICRNFRRKIEELGGSYQFGTQVEGLDCRDGKIRGVHTSSGYIPTQTVILGIGHSARDTYQMLYDLGVPMQPKAFQLGLRIEQPQENVNSHKYGKERYLDLLGAADYTIVAKGERDLYTFCMCAGGFIIPSVSEAGYFCSNGMSRSRKDTAYANSGLMVTLKPEEFGSSHPLAGMKLQQQYEQLAFAQGGGEYLCPIQPATDFVEGITTASVEGLPSSYERGIVAGKLDELLPPEVVRGLRTGLPIMDQKWRGNFLKDATLVGPEMRGSAPLRIDRDWTTRQTQGFEGLYPVGEGAGYAGGIISAAVDGLRSAMSVVANYAPLQENSESTVSNV